MRLILLVTLAISPLRAHHGAEGFDGNKPVHLTGKVTRVEWENPHVVLHVTAAGVEWQVVTIPPIAAVQRGFTQGSFVGAEISADGHQALDGTNRMNATRVALPDGRTVTQADCFAKPPQPCFVPRGASDR